MSELSDLFGQQVDLRAVRDVVHRELDTALDELFLELLDASDEALERPAMIALFVSPALTRHIHELLP